MRRKPDWSGPPGKWTAVVEGEVARLGQGKEGLDRNDDPAGLVLLRGTVRNSSVILLSRKQGM